MAGENKTVLEMEALGESGKGKVYTITKKQAETVLTKLGHKDKMVTAEPDPIKPTGELQTFIAGDHAKTLQERGGLEGKVARIATKYLRVEGSETTILLSDPEHKQIAKMGVTLKQA